jgi:polygalacturonase
MSESLPNLDTLRRTIMFMKSLVFVVSGWLIIVAPLSAQKQVVNVRDLGAVPDGKTICTSAIQKAIDRCNEIGGGTVYLPPGNWLSGTLFLKSNVTLYLEAGSTLLGSADSKDYPDNIVKTRSYTDTYVKQSLIAGEDLENVSIRGQGTIDGQGAKFRFSDNGYGHRPYTIRLVGCRDVLVEDVHLRNSAMWMQHYLACDRVRIHGVQVSSHVNGNNDGLDIDGCHDFVVSDCVIDSDDDAIVLKATSPRSNENVTITNCVLSSLCNALKMGTESTGGCKNLIITNCAIHKPRPSERGIAGIALEIVDGGDLDRVTISNITIDGYLSPIFLRLGNRARPYTKDSPNPPIGTFRNVILSNIVATDASKIGCPISGIPGHRIENVTLSNIRCEFEGGGTPEDAQRKIEEREADYPECGMFGTLPAYGLYCRHVKGLRLLNVQFTPTKPDARPALVFDDAEDVLVDGKKP